MQLKNSIYNRNGDSKFDNIEEECKSYLNKQLPKKTCWGGMETLKAVSNIYSENILICNENESCFYFNRFKHEFGRTIILAYRLASIEATKPEKLLRNHYDSVSMISQNDIFDLAKDLLEKNKTSCDVIDIIDETL